MESTNNKSTGLSKEESYKLILDKLECPFNWCMNDSDIIITEPKSLKPEDEIDKLSFIKFAYAIVTMYAYIKNSIENTESTEKTILENLEKCKGYYTALSNTADREISMRVAESIWKATKCFVYFHLRMEPELELSLTELENIDDMSPKERSTLLAFQSVCWSKYRKRGASKAEQLIREAIKLNDNCGLWHHLLGKVLRSQRRASSNSQPRLEEENSFLRAYETSKQPAFGIFVAQMYRESKKYREAEMLYKEIFESLDSLSDTILLRLALGLIRQKHLESAKVCLDKAEKNCANRSMYLHYRASYHMEKGDFEQASTFFKEAIKDNNLPAEKEYLKCLMKLSKDFNVTQYLVDMLNKWSEKISPEETQPLILDVAFSYWKSKHPEKSIEYFLRALEIEPQSLCLTESYSNYILSIKEENVYVFLEECMLPMIYQNRIKIDEDDIEQINDIEKYCELNRKAQMDTIKNALNSVEINK